MAGSTVVILEDRGFHAYSGMGGCGKEHTKAVLSTSAERFEGTGQCTAGSPSGAEMALSAGPRDQACI
jgi:hypothetical protein